MSDKMQEEFEAWYADTASKATGMKMTSADVAEKRCNNGNYGAYAYIHGCWIGWQASRRSLVVKLPEGMTLNELRYGSKPKPDHERLLPRDTCVKAIESLGLRVKP